MAFLISWINKGLLKTVGTLCGSSGGLGVLSPCPSPSIETDNALTRASHC